MGYGYKAKLFDPKSTEPFKISRSKIDFFLECPRCYYLDQRLGVKRPDSYPLTLNIAVDHLLKKEFDIHRAAKTAHPMMETYGIDAVPFQHPKMDEWRENFKGIQVHHEPTNFTVTGAVDDIWVNPAGELIVVDYKATAKATAPTLDGDLGAQYQRQMEVYQWLLKQSGFKVSPTGYFVYVNGKKDAKAFDAKLEFTVSILPCTGDTGWVDPTLAKAKDCLMGELPASGDNCKGYCAYRKQSAAIEQAEKPKKAVLPKKPKEPTKGGLF
jgi:hypothetical protein